MLFKAENSRISSPTFSYIDGVFSLRIAAFPYPAGSFFHDEVLKPYRSFYYTHGVSPNAEIFKIYLPPHR